MGKSPVDKKPVKGVGKKISVFFSVRQNVQSLYVMSQAKTGQLKNRFYNRFHVCNRRYVMPKARKQETSNFGQRLAALRKAKGFTQQELADEIGLSRRMVAYYEAQSGHPPTTHLPDIARVLKTTTDELLGSAPIQQKTTMTTAKRDSRLERRLQQIEKLDPAERRQLMQVIDAYIERGQLKRKVRGKSHV
jgi:transcriptional regulator with XRE-family HTH domain